MTTQPATAVREYANFIAGEWVRPRSGEFAPNINPAHRHQVLGLFPRSSAEDVEAAIEAAARAFPSWSRLTMQARGAILHRAADLLEKRLEEVATALTQEEGKTLAEARGETARGVAILRYFAGEASQPLGEVYPSASANTFLYTTRVPLGVVGLITPWNFPVAIPLWKLAPALVYGNTVVLKPAELTPLTCWLLVDILREAGLPPGVVNVVFGRGSVIGDVLVRDPRVAGISFTGSNAVGRRIYDEATGRGAKCQCEMGGKNPMIVLPDADLDFAVELTLSGAMRSGGQKCTATSRAIVVGDILDAFTEKLVRRAQEIKVGDGMDPATYMGPLVSESQRQQVLEYIQIGRAEGAELLCGGQALTEGEYADGFYVQPTVFGNLKPHMRIAREEIFGPVVGIMHARDLDEAIALANDVPFGLSASICTRDLGAAMLFAERIEAGIVHINSETAGAEPHVPFGGVKESSSHSREQGKAAREFFTHVKTVYLDKPPVR